MRGKKNLRKIAIILLWILVWAGAAKAVDNRILLVPPVDALKALWSMLQDADFYITVACSLSRISFGFLLGFGTGILLAVMGSRFPLLEEMLAFDLVGLLFPGGGNLFYRGAA